MGALHLNTFIEVRFPGTRTFIHARQQQEEATGGRIKTTVGRILINESLPEEMPYFNYELDKKLLES